MSTSVRVLWCDWLISEITRAAREYKKGGKEEKNWHLKSKNERGFLQYLLNKRGDPWPIFFILFSETEIG